MADYAHTISRAKISQLSLEEQARGFSVKYHIDYSDVNSGTVSTDTDTMTLGTLPSTYMVDAAGVNITTAFSGTTGAYAVVVGTTTTTNAFVTSQSVKTAGFLQGAVSKSAVVQGTTALNMVAVFTDTTAGAATSNTAGALDIYLNIVDLGMPNKLG